MNEPKMSVRARHKLETISLIHTIAESLALTQGLASTKIEEIASAAGVSRRTFFNYFPTKEDAVLGLQAPFLPVGAAERFEKSEADILTRTVWLVVDVIRTSTVASSSITRRRELRQRFPELLERSVFRATAAEKIIRPIVAGVVAKDDTDDVNVILSLAAAMVRYAYSIDPDFKDETIRTTIQIFTKTLRKTL